MRYHRLQVENCSLSRGANERFLSRIRRVCRSDKGSRAFSDSSPWLFMGAANTLFVVSVRSKTLEHMMIICIWLMLSISRRAEGPRTGLWRGSEERNWRGRGIGQWWQNRGKPKMAFAEDGPGRDLQRKANLSTLWAGSTAIIAMAAVPLNSFLFLLVLCISFLKFI